MSHFQDNIAFENLEPTIESAQTGHFKTRKRV